MNELQKFTYDFSPEYFGTPASVDIRVVIIEDVPWFVAKDVGFILGYISPANAVAKFCKYAKPWNELKGVTESVTLQPALKLIPESDLYRLIMKSNLEEAVRFQDWVCEKVLPTIRKIGAYMIPEYAEEAFKDPDFIVEWQSKLNENEVHILLLTARIHK